MNVPCKLECYDRAFPLVLCLSVGQRVDGCVAIRSKGGVNSCTIGGRGCMHSRSRAISEEMCPEEYVKGETQCFSYNVYSC